MMMKLSHFSFMLHFTYINLTVLAMNMLLMKWSFLIKLNLIWFIMFNIAWEISYKSLFFNSIVALISSYVFIFSSFYMSKEGDKMEFFKTTLLFIASMLLMVFSLDTLSLFMGWDGLGLTSYLLVMFYFNFKSIGSAQITLISNRVGDSLIMTSCIISLSKSNNFLLPTSQELISLPVLAGSMTKSAQIPFNVWLPEAMAAPTPVSSLVHSSTLVTAGVYYSMRFMAPIMNSGSASGLMMISIWTCLIGGMMGALTLDLKKMIAMSTLSQLGLMMATLSMGWEKLAYNHLITHALFKALLFICGGCEIMNNNHSQMMKHKEEASASQPTSKLVSLLSMNAVPFSSGFITKDSMIEMNLTTEKMEMSILLLMAVSLTSLYSWRMWINSSPKIHTLEKESNNNMKMQSPHLILAVLTMIMSTWSKSDYLIKLPIYYEAEHWLCLMFTFIGLATINLMKMNSLLFLTNTFFSMKKITKMFAPNMMNKSKAAMMVGEASFIDWLLPSINKVVFLLSNNILYLNNSSLMPLMTMSVYMVGLLIL